MEVRDLHEGASNIHRPLLLNLEFGIPLLWLVAWGDGGDQIVVLECSRDAVVNANEASAERARMV